MFIFSSSYLSIRKKLKKVVKKSLLFYSEITFREIAWILNPTFPEQTKNRKHKPAVKQLEQYFRKFPFYFKKIILW
jgi:hypothetical protein